MQTAPKYTFDDIPSIMANLVNQIQDLKDQIQALKNMSETTRAPEEKHKSITTNEVAELLHKQPTTVYRMAEQGRIPCYKQGNKLIYFKDEILAWISTYKKSMAVDMLQAAEDYCSANPI